MRNKLKLEMAIKEENEKTQKIIFQAPVELLLSGFKFSYVSPEKLEEQIYDICSGDRRFFVNAKNNCLEESLLNFPSHYLRIDDEIQQLSVNWVE